MATVAALFVLSLLTGSVSIPATDVLHIVIGKGEAAKPSWQYIVLENRLPQALTALLCGSALAASGLMLQTAFRNALADPGIFGISSGAALGVALVMLLFGGSIGIGSFGVGGYMAVIVAAFTGAMAVMAIILFFAARVRHNVMLLIIGIMTGYVASSAIALLQFLATDEGVKSYMVWGMGTFSAVSMRQMPVFATATVGGLAASLLLVKPLNALLLGERYAENLGISIRRIQTCLLLVTGLLTAVTTAFCGPVSFIGLAVPHVARLLLRSDNHRVLMPVTMLCGAAVALVCNLVCFLPGEGGIIPLGAVTPLMGAPVIIYIIAKQRTA
jgi:iron complex transport system permease protein